MSLHPIIFFELVLFQYCICAGNETQNYLQMDQNEFKQKSHRFIHFNADSGDLTVELAFNVPFITIPTKKAFNMTKGALANVHVGSIALAGAVVVGAGFVLPGLYRLFVEKGSLPLKSDRSDQKGNIIWNQLNSKIQKVLQENEVDTTTCFQRVTCWIVKNSSTKVSKGIGSSTDKIIDGVFSNVWFKGMIQDTFLHHPVKLGQNGGSCVREYGKCKFNQMSFQGIFSEILKTLYV